MGSSCFKKQNSLPGTTPSRPPFARKPLSCFFCGKLDHISKEYRSRLANEKPAILPPVVKTELHQPSVSSTPSKYVKREVTCFSCHQKGYKSPQCPLRQTQVKKMQIPADKVRLLGGNDLFGSVGPHRLPITCDSGADISVVPEECVAPDQFTGQVCEIDFLNRTRSSGKLCDVIITVNGRQFRRKAVTQTGKDLAWTACLSIPLKDRSKWDFVLDQIEHKQHQDEEETLYLPPVMKDGILISGILVSEGTLVETKHAQESNVSSNHTPVVAEQQVEVSNNTQEEQLIDSSQEVIRVEEGEVDEQKGHSEEILRMEELPTVDGAAEGDLWEVVPRK